MIECAVALVAEWHSVGLAIARSRVRIHPAATVYQRQLSVPSRQGRLISTQLKLRLTAQHAMHLSRIRGRAALAWVRLRSNEAKTNASLRALEA